MSHSTKFYLFLVFACAVFFGARQASNSWDKNVYYYLDSDHRTPAAAKGLLSTDEINNKSFTAKMKQDLFSEPPKISFKNKKLSIQLHQFFLRKKDSVKNSCKIYETIDVTFRALNMAVSGRPIEMVVQVPCITDPNNVNLVKSVHVDLSHLMNNSQDISGLISTENDYSLRVDNLNAPFPKAWKLKGATWTSPRAATDKPLSFNNWTTVQPFLLDDSTQ